MAESVTAKEVAQRADVSVGTVSRVFNNHTNVSEEIRQRVLKVAAELGYFRVSGQVLSTRPTTGRMLKEVGFLYCSSIEETPAIMDPYWTPIFHGMEGAARKANIKITYRTINDICRIPHLLTTTLYEMRLGGVLLVGQADAEVISTIQATHTPVVQVDNFAQDLVTPVDTILPDNCQGAAKAMDYLFSMGHQQIAFIGGPSSPGRGPISIYSAQQRWMHYCMSFLDRGLSVSYELVEPGNFTLEGGYEGCMRLLERKVPFSAIFCVDDVTAIGALKALREAGKKVPEDVSIIGFDGIDLGQHVTPSLTTIRVDTQALGEVALNTLIERAAHPDEPYLTKLMGTELVKRESVAAPRPT